MDVIDGILPEGGPEQGKQAGEKGRDSRCLSGWGIGGKDTRGKRYGDSMPGSMRADADRDLEAFEEERRLFYVGVTRAKERLILFTINQKSVFGRELMQGVMPALSGQSREGADIRIGAVKAVHGGVGRGRDRNVFSGEAFAQFCEALGEGLIVVHKMFGEGVVTEMEENWVMIRFGERESRFELRTLFVNNLLKWQ